MLKTLIGGSVLKKRLLGGFAWTIAGALSSKSLTLLASIIVSRQLGKVGFGELGILNSTVNMLGEMAGLGIGIAATKYIAELRESAPDRASRVLSLNALISLGSSFLVAFSLYLYSAELADSLLKNLKLAPLLQIAAVTLFFSALHGGVMGALVGFEAFRQVAKLNVLNGFVSLALQFAFVSFWGLQGVVIALLLAQMITFVVGYVLLNSCMRMYGVRFAFDNLSSEANKIVTFNLPALLAAFMVVPVNWACNVLLVNQPDGYGQMGIFNAANQWKMALLFIPSTLGSVILPVLSSLIGVDAVRSYKKVLYYNILANFAISLAVIGVVSLLAPYIMSSYGEGFGSQSMVLRVLIISAGLMALNNVIGHAIASLNRMWAGFLFNLLWACTMIVSAYWLCPSYGALGLAVANLIAYLLHTVWQFLYVIYSIESVFDFGKKSVVDGDQT